MAKLCAGFTALLFVFGIARGLGNSAVVKRSTLSNEAAKNTAAKAGFGTVALSNGIPNVSPSPEWRRRLMQSVGKCGFDFTTHECGVGVDFTLDLLEEADNPVAAYVSKVISCNQFSDALTCARNNCLWLRVYCAETADDYRALHNAPCAKDASKIVEEIARTAECLGLTDRTSCEGRETCHWRSSGCNMDQWNFHYEIPTLRSGDPKGLHELVEQRRKEFTDFLQSIYNETDAESSLNAILHGTLPTIPCPRGVPSILCKFADAIASDARPTVYCQLKHRSRRACNADDRCQASSSGDAECTASSNEVDKAVRRAKDVFDDNIQPPYMQRLVKKRTVCNRISRQAKCTGECEWLTSGCVISHSEVLQSLYDQFSDRDAAVCKFLALDLSSGCSKHNEKQCNAAGKCAWIPYLISCHARLVEWVATALESSGLEGKFRSAAQRCENSGSISTCAAASSYGDGTENAGQRLRTGAAVVLGICSLVVSVVVIAA